MEKNKILEFIRNSLYTKVTYSAAGGAVGSIWAIDLGEAYFFIECAWRLSKGDRVIVTHWDDTTFKTGRIFTLVPLLVGRTLLSVNLSRFYDLTLLFDEDYRVDVFCDGSFLRTDAKELVGTNWFYARKDQNFAVEINTRFQAIWGKCDE